MERRGGGGGGGSLSGPMANAPDRVGNRYCACFLAGLPMLTAGHAANALRRVEGEVEQEPVGATLDLEVVEEDVGLEVPKEKMGGGRAQSGNNMESASVYAGIKKRPPRGGSWGAKIYAWNGIKRTAQDAVRDRLLDDVDRELRRRPRRRALGVLGVERQQEHAADLAASLRLVLFAVVDLSGQGMGDGNGEGKDLEQLVIVAVVVQMGIRKQRSSHTLNLKLKNPTI